jgi:vitamin B12 transporter
MNGVLFMTGVLRVKYLFLLGCSLGMAAPALAQDAGVVSEDGDITLLLVTPDHAITVVATGNPAPVSRTGQSISVTGLLELQSIQGPDLTRVLERLPGVTITRNGGLGNFTGVRVRGAEAEQLLVLVDGVRMADMASPGGGYDFGNLTSGGIGKIELLRGSNSVVWGSQAIGGVLAVTSRAMDGVEASAEYGALDSLDASATAGVSGDRYNLALNGGYTRTDGISTAAVGTEPDGFRQWRIGGRGMARLNETLSATLTARYADSRLDQDGFPPPAFAFADTREYSKTREASGRAGLAYDGAALDLDGGFALSETRRAYFDAPASTVSNFATQGRSERLDLSGHADLPAGLNLTFGGDSEWSRFSTSFDAEKRARLASGHALLGFSSERLNLAAGLRIDDHSGFGSQWTFGANGSYAVADGWRIRASYGEGFKAPTLFQLFSDFGNGALVPERSRSYDFGIEKGDRNGPLHVALTAFRRDSRDLIDFVSCFGVSTGICAGRPFGTYNNVRSARAEGVEAELGGALTDRVQARATYSYVKATNRVSGLDLARRPRHALSLSADWQTPLHDLSLGADLRVVSHSFDDAGNITRLAGFALVTLRASLPVTERIELFGRIENLGDKRYQTAAGYAAQGRSAYIGARARF